VYIQINQKRDKRPCINICLNKKKIHMPFANRFYLLRFVPIALSLFYLSILKLQAKVKNESRKYKVFFRG